MSSPKTPPKRISQYSTKYISIKRNNNSGGKQSRPKSARHFISWYKSLIDNERQNIGLYLADDIILEWFGRTVKTRKKVFGFLKDHMQFSKHFFTSVNDINKIQFRQRTPRKDGSILASPNAPDTKFSQLGKRHILRSSCNSPEWAPGCCPEDEFHEIERKKSRSSRIEKTKIEHKASQNVYGDSSIEFNSNGDGISKPSNIIITPPNKEYGQGDCMPSTSSSDSNRSHDALNAQLPKLAVECNGFVEFTRERSGRNTDNAKWERKCKLQISYSEDPLNFGEFIIWGICYSDESKCRRNLLAAFEEVDREENCKNI